MAELPTPTATRLQNPSWRDIRLFGGVALVLLSVAAAAAQNAGQLYWPRRDGSRLKSS